MTNEKAIDIFNRYIACHNEVRCYTEIMCKDCEYNVTVKEVDKAMQLAISALKKQESKKPLKMKDCKLRSPYSCPECYTEIPPGCEYCWRCGKKIDWSKEEDNE